MSTESTQGNVVQWSIGADESRPVLHVSPEPVQRAPGAAFKVDPKTAGLDRLGPLFQAMPTLAVAGETAQHSYMRVVIDGPLTLAKDGNGYRAFSHDGKKITEHARLFDGENLNTLVSSAALFQIASVVVAQKHLADISEKLSDIKRGVENIQETLDGDRKAKIVGALNYLQQVWPVVLAGQSSGPIRQKIEDHESELGVVQSALEAALNKFPNQIATLEDPDRFGTSGLTKALQRQQADFEKKAEEWKLCMGARFVACHLLGAFSEETMLQQRRQQCLKDEVSKFFGNTGVIQQFSAALTKRAANMSAFTESSSTTFANKLMLSTWQEEELQSFVSSAAQGLGHMQQLLLEQQAPVVLTLKMQGRECVEAYQVPAPRSKAVSP